MAFILEIYPRKFLYEADFQRSAKFYILENNSPYGISQCEYDILVTQVQGEAENEC